MNYPALILGFVFLAVGLAFAKAARAPEPLVAKNKRLASNLMFVASPAFFIAFAFSAFTTEAAR